MTNNFIPPGPDGAGLTPREREVLEHLANGLTTRQIADRLHRSIKTIETHRAHLAKKLETRNVALLTKYAIRHGLVTVDG